MLTIDEVLARIKAKYGSDVTDSDVETVKSIAGMDTKTINALMIFMWGAFQGGIQNTVSTSLKEQKELNTIQEENIEEMMNQINDLMAENANLSSQITQLWNAIASISQG